MKNQLPVSVKTELFDRLEALQALGKSLKDDSEDDVDCQIPVENDVWIIIFLVRELKKQPDLVPRGWGTSITNVWVAKRGPEDAFTIFGNRSVAQAPNVTLARGHAALRFLPY